MQNCEYLFKLLIHGEAHVILTDDPILVGVQGFEGLPHPVIPLLILLHLGDRSNTAASGEMCMDAYACEWSGMCLVVCTHYSDCHML